jgi:hypothetical protein
MNMHIYQIPCVSFQYLSDADRSRLFDPQRDSTTIACMYDPSDPLNGIFLWVDEVEPGTTSEPPEGYSDGFQDLWCWAQEQGYSWLRLVEWGDQVEGLPISDEGGQANV